MSSFDGPLGDAALQDKMSDTGDIELWPPNLLAAGTSSTCVTPFDHRYRFVRL